jgi:LysM repeat protein
MSGCYREVVPDVTAVPEGEEGVPSSEDQVATAIAEATRAAEAAGEPEGEQPAEEAEPAPTTAPAPTDTPPPAAEPTATEVPPTQAPATQAPAPTNTPSPPPATAAPAQTTGTGVHVVQRGENLFRIALRYGTTVQAIASANGIANPQQIYVGQRLVIPGASGQPAPAPQPGGSTHVVRAGENLFRIALRYNLNYHYLAQYNGITNPSQIRVGQVLRIPPH